MHIFGAFHCQSVSDMMGRATKINISKISNNIRKWASGKLVEYESLQVSNGRVESVRVRIKMVKL